MNIKQLALVLGATVALVGGGMGAVACSSSSSGGNPGSGSSSGGSGSSSGSSGGMDSSAGNDTGTNEDSGESDAGTTTVDCGKLPSLHPNPAGDVYCGFNGDSGPALDCDQADSGAGWCCLGGSSGPNYFPQLCASGPSGCTNGVAQDAGGYPAIPIQCNQISDCAPNGAPGATACCLQGGAAPATVAGCGYPKSKGGTAVVCEGDAGGAATACTAGEVQICSADTDCPNGMHCIAGKWKIFQIGFCM